MTLYQQGYCDGVEGKAPQRNERAYRAGYRHGADPQGKKTDDDLSGQDTPRSGAWGLDYRRVSVDDFEGWILLVTRLEDGKLLACYHGDRRPEVAEVRRVLARALAQYRWPEIVWVDEWLSRFAAQEVEKHGIRMHLRLFRKGGIERNEYDARLDRVMQARRDRFRPAPPTPPTSAVKDREISHSRLEAAIRHWVN